MRLGDLGVRLGIAPSTLTRNLARIQERGLVKLTAERAATDPKVFTRIHMHWTVRGRGLKRNIVENAVKLTHEKYCSATAMLAKSAEITTDFEIREGAAPQT